MRAIRTIRRRQTITTIATLAIVVAGLVGCRQEDSADEPPPDEPGAMVDRANEVMPFDLTTTTHTFTRTDTGGIQEVVAHDPTDVDTVALIRSHLEDESAAFRDGDFGDPATIHGADMAGLAVLEDRAGEVEVVFEPIEAGGRITYTATDPELLDALHAWFDHQNADHSMPGMGG
jgi:hypothetical protein